MVLSDNARAALLMTASMAMFTANDTCIKALGETVPLFQVIFLRGILVTLALLVLTALRGGLRVRLGRHDWTMAGLRTIGEAGAAYFFITALFNMPLANATAILQSLPLAVTLAGAMFLGERVGWGRLLAILAGLVGVLMIVRPGTEGFNLYSVFAMAAVGFMTLRDLSTRRLSPQAPTLTVAPVSSLGVTIFGGVGSLTVEWAPMGAQAWLLLLTATVLLIGAYLTSVSVMRIGEIAFVAPFRYTGLVWALLLGFVVFGDWPRPLTILGAAIVVFSGVFAFLRSRQPRPPVPLALHGR